MLTILESLLLGGLTYLAYLLYKFPNRAIGTSKRQDPTYRDLPGWPLIGHLGEILVNGARPLEYYTVKSLRFRPGFSLTIPGIRFIDISKPEWLEYVQKTNFNNYVKGPIIYTVLKDVFGDGIFAVDGAPWKKSRHVTSTLFSKNSFKSIMLPSANKSISGLTQALESAYKEGRSLDFCHLWYCFSLDSFLRMTFGKELGLLGKDFGKQIQSDSSKQDTCSSLAFAEAFDFSQDQIDFRFTTMFAWQLIEKVNSRMRQKMELSCNILDEFVYSSIDERTPKNANPEDRKKSLEFQNDFLGLLMIALDERGNTLDRKELRDNAINVITAGRDTTAQTLTWGFFHLLKNQHMISRIREETIEILGEDWDDVECVTPENYKMFTYTHSVVLETLRLHPSAPKNFRFAVASDQIPGGPMIEAGDCVRWSDWQMGRDPEIWGTDCGEFKPSRWLTENNSLKQFSQFKFHAFNGGPRLCLGINLATFQAIKVLVETFRKFDLNFADGWLESVSKSEWLEGIHSNYQTPMYRVSLTLPMKNPMMISVTHLHKPDSSK